MQVIRGFLANFDFVYLGLLVLSAVAVLLCLTVHELCHGLAAYLLGDPTAKRAGRLTLSPLAHIDWLGFALMLVARVGWAKPVPVDIRSFKHPKRDMAITAAAGPLSNFVLALVSLLLGSLVLTLNGGRHNGAAEWVLFFLCSVAVMSVGLGLFNLIPIPPLDGSKLLFSVLPDRLYYGYLRCERYLLLVVVALAWFGFFSGPLGAVMGWVLERLCVLTRFPYMYIHYSFGI